MPPQGNFLKSELKNMTFSNKTLHSKMTNNKSRVCNNWINIVSILGMWPLSRDGGRATAPPPLKKMLAIILWHTQTHTVEKPSSTHEVCALTTLLNDTDLILKI